MLQKLIPRDVNPAFICTSYRNDMEKYNIALKLSKKEQTIVANLNSDGFKKCDTPLLYKLCQYFDFVSAPLEGWGKFNDKLQNIGDAVEAMVKLRYENISNPTGEFKERFDRIVEIAKVVDKELHVSTNERFEDAVKSLLMDNPEDRYIKNVTTAFQQITEEATNGQNGSFEDDVLEEVEPICFDEEYDTDIWKEPIVLLPALFQKTESDTKTKIQDINKLCEQGTSKCIGHNGMKGDGIGLTTIGTYPLSSWKLMFNNGQLNGDGVCKIYEGIISASLPGTIDALPCSKRSLKSRKRKSKSAQLDLHSVSSK